MRTACSPLAARGFSKLLIVKGIAGRGLEQDFSMGERRPESACRYRGRELGGTIEGTEEGAGEGAGEGVTAAGIYDLRQLQLGPATESSSDGLSVPTGCCRFGTETAVPAMNPVLF